MKTAARGKKRMETSTLLLDLLGKLMELGGKEGVSILEKKTVRWYEPLVGKGKD